MMTWSGVWKQARAPACVAAITLAGALLLLKQNRPDLTSSVLGLGGDPYQTLWRFTALGEAVKRNSLDVEGEPFRNFGPLPWLPLHLFLGEPLTYNVVWILQVPLAAVGTYALGRVLGLRSVSSGLAGILVAFAPYRLAQSLGHFGAMQLFWIPAVLTTLILFLRSPSVPRALLCALLLIGASWTEHTLFLTALIAACVTFAVLWPDSIAVVKNRRGQLAAVVLCAVTFLGAVVPFWGELRASTAAGSMLNLGNAQRLRFAPTVRRLWTIPAFHPLLRSPSPYGSSRETVADGTVALGVLAPILAIGGALALRKYGQRQSVILLGALAATGLVLSLAPRTSLGETLYAQILVLSSVRTVNRFLVLTTLAVPLLAASFAVGTRRGLRPALPRLLIGGLLFLEILPSSFPAQHAKIPDVYASLASTAPGALLEIPAATDYLIASQALYATTAHHRPLAAHSAFERVSGIRAQGMSLRVPVVSDLLLLQTADLRRPTLFGQIPVRIARAAFASENIAAVVLHEQVDRGPVYRLGKDGSTPASARDLQETRAFLQEAAAPGMKDGEGIVLFHLPAWPASESAFIAIPDHGWNGLFTERDGTRVVRVDDGAQLVLRVLGTRPISPVLTVGLRDPRSASVTLTSSREATEARADDSGRITISLGTLPPGEHRFSLRTVDGNPLVVENPTVTERSG